MDAAIRKAKDSINQIFDKNLHDLVRGIRNHKENESKYIAECIDEIKVELKQDNMAVKANAINKLCYLQMMGYDISWAAFNIIEVMSSTKFTYKRIGYLAASQVFHSGTDVLMLTTNLLRKDLGSQNMYEAGTALSGLACFITPDLARDLASEIMKLMTSSRPYLRKKAVLIMYKIFLNYPDSLRPSFPRLKEKLDDSEASVQAAAVNVICELARKNPKNYLSLAPIFFKLMTVSTNNWVLIKIIKLFGALTPLEPRLGKKLIEPLTNIINSTSAMSLLYECINTVLAVLVSISSGQPNHNAAIQVCLQKLRILIEDSDQNLKYLGLLAMSKILETSPTAVHAHKDLVMSCLDDKDESIRLRALDLLCGMVTKKTLMEIVRKLMAHMQKAEGTHYRDQLLAKCVSLCSHNNYQFVASFEWYVSVLVELTRMEGTRHGKLLANQMLDVAIRVESIRKFMVAQMAILVDNVHVFRVDKDGQGSDICEVLYAATWICGEFASCLEDAPKTLDAMLRAKLDNLPGHIQAAFVQNIFKLYAHIIKHENLDSEARQLMTKSVVDKLHTFEQSADIEVQERACSFLQLLKYVQKEINSEESEDGVVSELWVLFEGALNPVAPKAQKKVPIPDGLDLDAWINDPPSEDEQPPEEVEPKTNSPAMFQNKSANSFTYAMSSQNYSTGAAVYHSQQNASVGARKMMPELSHDDIAKLKDARKQQQDSNPFYIKSGSGVKKSESNANKLKLDDGPGVRSMSIELKTPFSIPGVSSSEAFYRASKIDDENEKLKKKMRKKKQEKKSKKDKKKKEQEEEAGEEEEEEKTPQVTVLENEMPEGAVEDDDEDAKKKLDPKDPHRALDIDLDEPLKDDEILPTPQHRSPTSGSIKKDASIDEPNKLKDKKESKKGKVELVQETTSDAKKEKKKEKKEKEPKEKKSKKKTALKNDSIDLLISTDQNHKRSESDYNELLSPEHENVPANNQPELESNNKVAEAEKEADDMEFWLSNDVVKSATNEQPPEQAKTEKKSSKSGKSKEEKNDEKSTKKKSKKSKKTDEPEDDSKLKNDPAPQNKPTDLKLLAKNKNLSVKYSIKPNQMNFNQIVARLVLKNEDQGAQINSIELNILNNNNVKLCRNESTDSDEPIKLEFNLSPGASQQTECYFTINDCTFVQVLKGNFIYMIKNQDSMTTQEKLDFKLTIPCSSFLTKALGGLNSDEFSNWLASGQLTSKKSIKFATPKYDDIHAIIRNLTQHFELEEIEVVDNTASFFTSSIKSHPICLLIKFTVDNSVTIDAKSTSSSLIEGILEEMKNTLEN